MAGKKKSKKFVVATEGATVDGRTIERSWIEQMAASYDPATYRAGINLEHVRGTLPDGPFKNYGFVDGLSTQESADKKLQLLAEINPTNDLVDMTAKAQKVFTSVEINPNFAKTGKAYLVGLAVTDRPASLGTEMLEFTAKNPSGSPLTALKQNPDNHFSVATETAIEFEDETQDGPGLWERVNTLLHKNEKDDSRRFGDMGAAIEEIATAIAAQSTATAAKFDKVDGTITELTATNKALGERLEAIEKRFATEPGQVTQRQRADGGAQQLADF